MVDASPESLGDFDGSIGAAGVEHDHVVAPSGRLQAKGQIRFFVLGEDQD
jgi:hypothetical protein